MAKTKKAAEEEAATLDPKHREKRWYTRPEDHAGPNPAIVGATQKRVAKGETFPLHTTLRQHEQMLSEGYKEATKKAVKEETAPPPEASQVTRGTEEEVKGG